MHLPSHLTKASLYIYRPNRSARRSKAYHTAISSLTALQTTLGNHIAPSGIIACWITNSAATRSEASECFEAWDMELIEEWYWLKVTRDGQPVTDVCSSSSQSLHDFRVYSPLRRTLCYPLVKKHTRSLKPSFRVEMERRSTAHASDSFMAYGANPMKPSSSPKSVHPINRQTSLSSRTLPTHNLRRRKG